MCFSKVINRFEGIVWDFRRNNTLVKLEYVVQYKINITTYYKPFDE